MAFIEDNIKKRKGEAGIPKEDKGPRDPFEDLYRINRYTAKKQEEEEGNVTNSLAMLTAIPEVDLGIESVPVRAFNRLLTSEFIVRV
jgi:hypothetical protein